MVKCTMANYPEDNCDEIVIYDKHVKYEKSVTSYVALCRVEVENDATYQKCGLAKLVAATQDTNGQKQLFATITGNSNTVSTVQTGTGQHYLNVAAQGNGNSATVNQSGSTANAASITLINAGAPASVNLTQSGGQNYTITQTCYTVCGTVTVRQ